MTPTNFFAAFRVMFLKQTRGFENVTLKAAKKFVGVAIYWEEQYYTYCVHHLMQDMCQI